MASLIYRDAIYTRMNDILAVIPGKISLSLYLVYVIVFRLSIKIVLAFEQICPNMHVFAQDSKKLTHLPESAR